MLFSIGLLTTGLSQDTPLLIPFSTTDDVDLKRSFSERIQSATIVGLGESTHYTKECYDLKFTLIQQLIEEGFNALVLEVDFGQALLWNRYVTYNEGNLDSLIASSGWFTYRTEEFKRLLKSIHDYNLTAEEPFQLAGMEMTAINHNLTWMQSFLDELGLKSAVLDSILHHEVPSIAFYNHSSADRKAYWSLFLELEDLLPKRTVASAKLSSLGVAYRMLEIFRQYATYVSQDDFSLKVELRDQFSSRNELWVLDEFGIDGRIVLWAHNGHVARNAPMSNYAVLGTHLSRWFGDAYYSVGFTFNKGTFGSFGPDGFENFAISERDTSFWTNAFIATERPFLLVDVRSNLNKTSGLRSDLRNEHTIRTDAGESFNADVPTTMPLVLGDTYDALIYFNTSHTPTSVPWKN